RLGAWRVRRRGPLQSVLCWHAPSSALRHRHADCKDAHAEGGQAMRRQTDGRRRTRLYSVPIRTVGAFALLLGLMLGWTSGGAPARAGLARTHTGPPYSGQPSTITERAALQRLF